MSSNIRAVKEVWGDACGLFVSSGIFADVMYIVVQVLIGESEAQESYCFDAGAESTRWQTPYGKELLRGLNLMTAVQQELMLKLVADEKLLADPGTVVADVTALLANLKACASSWRKQLDADGQLTIEVDP